jgi:hypothetical protein
MGKNFFAIILLIGVLVMNTGKVCQSLCLSGHGDMAKHEAKGDVCPIAHSNHHQSNHTFPDALIKCDCSTHFEASLDNEITLTSAVDLTPYSYNISEVQSYKTALINTEPIPLEDPPEILS